ncbi:PoNe immunity protein domain-containing protein [Citrobacter rodentium]|uniref:PoNi C-terminal domain-containing protein n=2 Tax=Citrobacter rodentium TaxID=67825 RepID=D2TQW0_CITRI|nr:PoNe immunity protein domain-containing protein [Citrobacter rodentium]QBY29895.1 DUF1911 domain-containing protein [Citrobacter rodentium]UHO32715.1 DUF1911 domain-containing protein [Citrobacter rodentium NBRC 105723 = DSM 16636]CBG90248.1 hypothetical protein ROD_35361 [Citrobacter rodentium ICC168]HAT8015602.1 hypothetical protein [Citrobacter rodentium NBRC 105723 = DSM 16636]HAT8020423.1 hypothetical protein [Citrobacter rodentium]
MSENLQVRDSRRDKAYFDKWIHFLQKAVYETRKDIDSIPIQHRILSRLSRIHSYILTKCIMKYGRGDPVSSFTDELKELVQIRKLFNEKFTCLTELGEQTKKMYSKLTLYIYYDFFCWLVFLYCSGGKKSDFLEVLDLFGHKGEDALLDHVAVLLGDTNRSIASNNTLVYGKIYKPLLDVILASENDRPALMKKFVEGWYRSMKPAAWHGNDKSYEGVYYGYWCFEAALVVNLLNIDDSSFKDNVYYPKDMIIKR